MRRLQNVSRKLLVQRVGLKLTLLQLIYLQGFFFFFKWNGIWLHILDYYCTYLFSYCSLSVIYSHIYQIPTIRKQKWLLVLKAVKRARELDATHPDTHRITIKFLKNLDDVRFFSSLHPFPLQSFLLKWYFVIRWNPIWSPLLQKRLIAHWLTFLAKFRWLKN